MKCNNCEKENWDDSKICEFCLTPLKNNGVNDINKANIDENITKKNIDLSKIKKSTINYKLWGPMFSIVGLILGIFVGVYYPSCTDLTCTEYNAFNWLLFTISFSSGVSLNLFFRAMYNICSRLDLIIEKE